MQRRWLRRIIIFFVIIGGLYSSTVYFYSIRPPWFSDFLYETTSPNGAYTVKAYVSSSTLSSDTVWCEYTANYVSGWTRIFYKEYRRNHVDIEWEDDNTVIINERILNLPFDEYIWWKDDNFESTH